MELTQKGHMIHHDELILMAWPKSETFETPLFWRNGLGYIYQQHKRDQDYPDINENQKGNINILGG